MTRTLRGFAAAFFSLFFFAGVAAAQSVSGYFAGGTATAPSAGLVNTLGDGNLYQAPEMTGFFGTVGGDFLFFHNEKLGVGAEMTFRKDKGPYAGLEYLPKFFDVNAVYQPFTLFRRVTPEIQLGYGRARLTTYDTPEACYKLPQGCAGPYAQVTAVSVPEAHAAVGLRFYAYKGIFIRPQLDVRWAHNDFGYYFGSSWIYQYSVGVGYTFHFGAKKSSKK